MRTLNIELQDYDYYIYEESWFKATQAPKLESEPEKGLNFAAFHGHDNGGITALFDHMISQEVIDASKEDTRFKEECTFKIVGTRKDFTGSFTDALEYILKERP